MDPTGNSFFKKFFGAIAAAFTFLFTGDIGAAAGAFILSSQVVNDVQFASGNLSTGQYFANFAALTIPNFIPSVSLQNPFLQIGIDAVLGAGASAGSAALLGGNQIGQAAAIGGGIAGVNSFLQVISRGTVGNTTQDAVEESLATKQAEEAGLTWEDTSVINTKGTQQLNMGGGGGGFGPVGGSRSALNVAQGAQNFKSTSKSSFKLNRILLQSGPKSIVRFDGGTGSKEMLHVHFADKTAIYSNGTYKHGNGHNFTNKEIKFLQKHGFTTPDK